MAFLFKNTKKDIIMTEKDEEHYKNTNVCRFCENNIESDKVRGHCHSTSFYRGPAHNTCYKNVTQQQNKYVPIIFHNFTNYDCHPIFNKFVDKNKDKVKFDIVPKTNEKYISVKLRLYQIFR